MPVTTTILANEPEPPPVGIPITDEELAMNRNWKGPRSSPLVRWSRLEPYLRARLGAVVSGAALDLPRLTRMIGKGLPLYFLPRRKRTTWAAQALVLWDDSPDMHGFKEDAAFLLTHLRRERGRHGLKVVTLRSLPDPSDLRKVPLGVPVLALSSLGQAAGSCTNGVQS